MSKSAEWLLNFRSLLRVYEEAHASVCTRFGLSLTEVDVLGYLMNHPERNTAKDIVEIRMIPKANVSVAVESLIQKGLLCRVPDQSDRRRIHLFPTAGTQPVFSAIRCARKKLANGLFIGFTPDEIRLFRSLHQKILDNAHQLSEKK